MPGGTRTFRVFVSSTFADFVAERNALHDFVFPRLRDMCEARGARFQAVDLRWGVSEQAAEDQQTLRTCLEEMRRCRSVTRRPNLIVLLGDRYGWRPLPPEISKDELGRIEQWVDDPADLAMIAQWYRCDDNAVPPVYWLQPRHNEYTDHRRWSTIERSLGSVLREATGRLGLPAMRRLPYGGSATEQEITLGLLDGEGVPGAAFCFVRSIEDLPADARAAPFRDLDGHGRPDREAESLLAGLRTRLRARLPDAVFDYRARWAGKGPTVDHIGMLCADVLASLERVIDEELRDVEQRAPVEQEADEHERFGRERCRDFVGRAEALAAVHEYLAAPASRPLLIIGGSGAGKSALMAQAFEQVGRQSGDVAVARFLGLTAASSTPRGVLESVITQIARAYGGEETAPPTELWELAARFADCLGLARPAKKLVVFLDALDQLGEAPDWLPVDLPPHVHVVVSALVGSPAEALSAQLSAGVVEVMPMPRAEAEPLLDAWLHQAGRTLRPAQRAHVIGKFEQTGLPLYLRLAFQESSRWCSYDGLPAGVGRAPGLGPDVPGLLRDLFARLAAESSHGPVLVAHGLAYLAAGRDGLTEDELLGVLSADAEVLADFRRRSPNSPPVRSLPDIVWSRLYGDLEPYLAVHSAAGTTAAIGFYHRQLAEVVAQDYLVGSEGRARHRLLANWFDAQPLGYEAGGPNLRKLAEWPFQLARAEQWAERDRCLMDFEFLLTKVDANGPAAVVEDFDLVTDGPGHADHLSTVRDAIRASAHVVASDPGQLASQLLGRLGDERAPRVRDLLAEACAGHRVPWLRPLTASLLPPGGLLQTFLTGRTAGEAVALTPEGQRLLGPTEDNAIGVWDVRSGRRLRLLRGHTGMIRALALTADGGRAVSAAGDSTLRVWDLRTGRSIRTITDAATSALAVAITADGRRLLAATTEHPLVAFDARSGQARAVLRGHTNLVRAIVFTPDGGRVISTGWDATVRVWDVRTGEQHRIFDGYGVSGEAVTVTPDGRSVVAAAEQGTVRVWDLESGEILADLAGHDNLIRALAVSPDGRFLASASRDRTVRIWELGTGDLVAILRGHTGEVGALAVTPDGRRLLSADGALRVWDLRTGDLLTTAGEHLNAVESIAVSSDGLLAVSTDGSRPKCWDLATGTALRTPRLSRLFARRVAITVQGSLVVAGDHALRTFTLPAAEPLVRVRQPWLSGSALAVSADGAHMVTTAEEHPVAVWDVESGEKTAELRGHTRYVRAIQLTGDGRRAVSASWDGTVRVWDMRRAERVRMLRRRGLLGEAVAITADGRLAFTASDDDTVNVWDLSTGQIVRNLTGHTAWVDAIAVTPDGRVAVSGSRDRTVRVWDVPDGREIQRLTGHSNSVNAVAVTADGGLAVSAAIDRTVRMWSLRSPATRRPDSRAHSDFVRQIAVSADDRLAVSAADDGTVQVWDVRTGNRLRVVATNAAAVWAVAVTPDGRRVVFGSRDHTLEVADLRTGAALCVLEGHREAVTAIAVSGDGRRAVSSSYDDDAIAWDLDAGQRLHTFSGHTSFVTTVAVTGDGRLAVTGSLDGSVRLWNVETGEQCAVRTAHPDGVEDLALTPDERSVISTGMNDSAVRIWGLPTLSADGAVDGPFNSVTELAIAPDGRTAVCAADDTWNNVVAIVDLPTRTLLRQLKGHSDRITQVAVSADGLLAVSASADHTLRVWSLADGGPVATFTADGGVVAAALTADAGTIVAGTESGELHFLRLEDRSVHGP